MAVSMLVAQRDRIIRERDAAIEQRDRARAHLRLRYGLPASGELPHWLHDSVKAALADEPPTLAIARQVMAEFHEDLVALAESDGKEIP